MGSSAKGCRSPSHPLSLGCWSKSTWLHLYIIIVKANTVPSTFTYEVQRYMIYLLLTGYDLELHENLVLLNVGSPLTSATMTLFLGHWLVLVYMIRPMRPGSAILSSYPTFHMWPSRVMVCLHYLPLTLPLLITKSKARREEIQFCFLLILSVLDTEGLVFFLLEF